MASSAMHTTLLFSAASMSCTARQLAGREVKTTPASHSHNVGSKGYSQKRNKARRRQPQRSFARGTEAPQLASCQRLLVAGLRP